MRGKPRVMDSFRKDWKSIFSADFQRKGLNIFISAIYKLPLFNFNHFAPIGRKWLMKILTAYPQFFVRISISKFRQRW
jgi:hypothetical protein